MTEISDIHKPLCLWLDREGIEYIRARSDRKSTIEKGWPDFTLMSADPPLPVLMIEAKLDKSKLSAAQRFVHARLLSKGFSVHVCRSVAAAVEVVERWRKGEIMRAVAPATDRGLRQRMGWVFKPTPSGQWVGFRKCGPDDVNLPNL